MSADVKDSTNDHSYLVFSLGGELFGTELLKVLEVMKVPIIKPVPYMKPAFKGLLNLRGQIISVIDLKTQFDMGVVTAGQGMVLIVETPSVPIGTIVDTLVAVESISEEEVDRHPLIETKIPAKYLLGVAKKNERLITLIDISGCLTVMDLRNVKTKENAA